MEGDTQHLILDNMNVEFHSGRFSVLLGPSGSGKSTILNLISGVDIPDKGDIQAGEHQLSQFSEKQRTLFRRQSMGIIFQFFNLIPTLNVLENVTLTRELGGESLQSCKKDALQLLEEVGLKKRYKTYPDRLSGGEQQRVAIARALCHNPDYVIADEPTGNLDVNTGQTIIQLLLKLTRERGKTLIMATHSHELIPLADHIYTLENHQLLEKTHASFTP